MAGLRMLHTSYLSVMWSLLWLIVTVDNSIGSTDDTEIDLHNVTVRDDTPHKFSSPGFPRCCTPKKYMFVKADPYQSMNWKVIFTDLDMPPLSQLTIYGIKEEGDKPIEIDSAIYIDGMWIRPVILYDGYALLIEFLPVKNSLKSEARLSETVKRYL